MECASEFDGGAAFFEGILDDVPQNWLKSGVCSNQWVTLETWSFNTVCFITGTGLDDPTDKLRLGVTVSETVTNEIFSSFYCALAGPAGRTVLVTARLPGRRVGGGRT